MSDPQEPVGEPVEEPESVDDVVGRAHEGLAEAEAAGRTATDENTTVTGSTEPAASEPATPAAPDAAVPEPAAPAPTAESAGTDAAPSDADEPAFVTPGLGDAPAEAEAAPAPGTESYAAAEPVVTPEPVAESYAASEPAVAAEPYPVADAYATDATAGAAAAASLATEPAAPQPIFVQAPEEPRPRGNRGAAGGIGLIAAVCFAFLYLDAGVVIGLVSGDLATSDIGTWLTDALTTWGLWVPTVVFFLAFWLLGAIINRGRWGVWVIFGLLVGVAAWGGHLLGQLFEAPFWNVTASEGADIVNAQLFAPLAIAAFIIGRELTIWFGAWVARRGRRMTELNVEARREYERTLEAGPQLAR
ncbi:ABC transporter [Microbacterium protaetiae]|uniref:ABC transporter n=1 Tax=Microbacterium protaetiae TaxID=2509458 RepID=A0A4P6EDA1_9MICO|nr:ABC transporter [Microbacterium protaetiae]QAY60232.1 ABC transporter [Microbacterium protaetiae]